MATVEHTDVQVWFRCTESVTAAAMEAALNTLCPEERERHCRLRFEEDRRDFALAHDLLRCALSAYDPRWNPATWEFVRDASGKPQLVLEASAAISFNLSHTRGFVACAISSSRVGVDVERIDRQLAFKDIAERHFSAPEVAAMMSLPLREQPTRFYELWTLKEALLKGLGCGLSGPLEQFSFEFDGPIGIRLNLSGGVCAPGWKFALFEPRKETRMAVAVECAELPQIVFHNLS